jgi:DNA-binding protein HU-beta
MNRAELVSNLAKKSGLTKIKTNQIIDSLLSIISESLSNGDKVTLVGFGTFTSHQRSTRKGRNPKTGEVVEVPAKRVPKFKAGTELIKSIN